MSELKPRDGVLLRKVEDMPYDIADNPMAKFHQMTRDTELYERMMQMTPSEILNLMGIPPDDASERLMLFIQETLDTASRKRESMTRQPIPLGKETVKHLVQQTHERRTA